MIHKLIPVVHRVFPFLLMLFCAVIFLPNSVHAANLFQYNGGDDAGSRNPSGISSHVVVRKSDLTTTVGLAGVVFIQAGGPENARIRICEIDNPGDVCTTQGFNVSDWSDYYPNGFDEKHITQMDFNELYDATAGHDYILIEMEGDTGGIGVSGDIAWDTYPVLPPGTPASYETPGLYPTYTIYDGDGPDDIGACTSGESKICTTIPANNSVVATSTPYTQGASGYISSADFKPGTKITQTVKSNSSLVAGFISGLVRNTVCLFTTQISQESFSNPKCGNTSTPINSAGFFNVSSTTVPLANPGRYLLTTTVITPTFSLFGLAIGQNTLMATTTTFLAGTSTIADSMTDAQIAALEHSIEGGGTYDPATCKITSGDFDIDMCLQYIFLPSGEDISMNIDNLRNGVLTDRPWGYGTRLITILTATTSTSTLPTWTVNIQTAQTSSTSLTFDMADMFSGGASLLDSIHDPEHGLNMRQIFEPWIQLFIAISVIIIIFFDLLSMGHHVKPSPKSAR